MSHVVTKPEGSRNAAPRSALRSTELSSPPAHVRADTRGLGRRSMQRNPPWQSCGDGRAIPVQEAAHWHFMPDQMVDLCLWVDPADGTILDCNAALTKALGHRRDDLVGRPLECLAATADLAGNAAAWQAMAHGTELTDADVAVSSLDGAAVPMSASSSLLRSRKGQALCGLVVWRDVSQRRRSQRSLVDSEHRLKTLAYELTLAESRERARIAQGLHDDIGQLLTMAHFKLDEWASLSIEPSASTGALIGELASLLKQAAQATRSATFDLSCPLLRPLGLQTAIEGMAQRVARASRLAVHVDGHLPALHLPEPVQAVVFRVVRELALNAQKHARAKELRIGLRCAQATLTISVADDGCGFEPGPTAHEFGPEGGFGLSSAEAQMQAVGGRLQIETGAGRGTRATLVLPLTAPAGA